MDGGRVGGDYISSLLSSSPRLDFGVPVLDAIVAPGGGGGGGDCGLDKLCGDPGFAERAARLSSFNNGGGGVGQRYGGAGAGLFGMPPPAPGDFAGGGSREASSVSDPASSAMKDAAANAKKRKSTAAAAAAAKGKGKEPPVSELHVSVNSACGVTSFTYLLLMSLTLNGFANSPGSGWGREGIRWQEVQDGQWREGELGEAEGGAGRERQLRRGRRRWRAEAREGEECQAGGATQGLCPCPGEARPSH